MSRAFCLALVVGLGSAAALAEEPPPLVVNHETNWGAVWVNLTLTANRIGEPYLPMVVAVQNRARQPVKVDRRAMWLIGPDRSRRPMAELKEVRAGYGKLNMDWRSATAAGIPVSVWRRQRRLRESNFFPDVSAARGATVIDRVTLRRHDALVDLVYFRTPPSLGAGRPFVLEISPEGWEIPIRLGLLVR